jgi:predicted 3-demethylubiquinone-9 3-methyltransferase (glyoxalase superfamily)
VAAKFYTSIFKNSKILDTAHYGESAAEVSGRPKGTVMTVTFELEGQRFMALNGGHILTSHIIFRELRNTGRRTSSFMVVSHLILP